MDGLGDVGKLWCVHFYPETVYHFHQIFKMLLDPEKMKQPPQSASCSGQQESLPEPFFIGFRDNPPTIAFLPPALEKHPTPPGL